MNESPNSDVRGGGPDGVESPGRMLSAARTARGLSIDQVAASLRYAPRQITALEYDDYGALPGIATVRGMVRAYAKLVGLDPQVLADALKTRLTPPPSVAVQEMAVPFPRHANRGHRTYVLWTVVLGVIAVLVLLEWRFGSGEMWQRVARLWQSGDRAAVARKDGTGASTDERGKGGTGSGTRTVTAAVETAPVSATAPGVVAAAPAAGATADLSAAQPGVTAAPPSDAAPAVPRGHRRIVLKFDRESWTQVRAGNGELLVNGLHRPGTEQVVSGPPPIQFVIGAAAGVRLVYDDDPVDLALHTKIDVARFTLE